MSELIFIRGERSKGKVYYHEIYQEFCEWSLEHAKMVEDYKPWGTNSIAVWLKNGQVYKVKRHAPGRFTMQSLSKEDIAKKYNLE